MNVNIMWCYLIWVIWERLCYSWDVVRLFMIMIPERCDKWCGLLRDIGYDINLELNEYIFDRVGNVLRCIDDCEM